MKNKLLFALLLIVPLMASPLMAEMVLSIPDNIPGTPGSICSVPININDGSDVISFDVKIFYDTSLFDLSLGDVGPGSLTSGWGTSANFFYDDGYALMNGFGTVPLPENTGSGSLLNLDFHVRADATAGTSPLTLDDWSLVVTGVNQNEITPALDSGSINVVPEPSTFVLLFVALGVAPVLFFRKRHRPVSMDPNGCG